MPTQDTTPIKEKIISFLRKNGPSLPVHIARDINMSILFTSAFLSELLSEKKVKTSNMRVGSSKLYLLNDQENQLEKFAHHLKSKEREAFNLLKEKKFLKDSEQEPAIRVAIREIKDFAVPFKKGEEVVWRYFTISENEFFKDVEKEKSEEKNIEKKEHPFNEKSVETNENANNQEEMNKESLPKKEKSFENPFEEKGQEKREETKKQVSQETKKQKKPKKRKTTSKKDSDFFIKVKELLSKNSLEMIDVVSFSKGEIILKVSGSDGEKILVAHNKRRINESDIIRSSKKVSEYNLPYIIACKGEPLKKVNELIEALQALNSIEKIE